MLCPEKKRANHTGTAMEYNENINCLRYKI